MAPIALGSRNLARPRWPPGRPSCGCSTSYSEGNMPSWFSAMLLMGCALVAALLAVLVRRAGGRDARYWAGLAAVLSLLSLDVVVALHERLGGPAAEVLGDATRGPLHF